MPIRPEKRALYPADWPAISLAVREAAGWRCQWPGCGVAQYAVGRWRQHSDGSHRWHPLCGNAVADLAGRALRWPDLQPITYREARAVAACNEDPTDVRLTVIVLTVAHLDHNPAHCDRANLRAWCQRHHLAYDAQHHAQTAYMTRRKALNNLELPWL